ncbi:MAG: DsbA family protein [Acidobacteria bacterium]|nr:DsbA family protein [Acidobacteriota bacterium]
MRIGRWLWILFLLVPGFGMAQTASPGNDGVCVGGLPNSPVKIEVFSDYQCPSCRDFYLGTMRSVLSRYADAGKVCVVYREFPLGMHPHAPEAARYAHAALKLGLRQWSQVTDALFASQDRWAQDGNVKQVVAGALSGADMSRLEEALKDPSLKAAIARDMELGRRMQVTATPTFFVTGRGKTEKVVGVVQYPILSRYLDSLLAP